MCNVVFGDKNKLFRVQVSIFEITFESIHLLNNWNTVALQFFTCGFFQWLAAA